MTIAQEDYVVVSGTIVAIGANNGLNVTVGHGVNLRDPLSAARALRLCNAANALHGHAPEDFAQIVEDAMVFRYFAPGQIDQLRAEYREHNQPKDG